MAWNESIITVSGIAMAVELMDGGRLEITKAEIGESVTETAALAYQKAIVSPIGVPVSLVKKDTTENGLRLTAQIQNIGAAKAYKMRQFGIYARTENKEEKLFAIFQSAEGEEIPPESEYPNFLLEFTTDIAMSNTDNISVVTNPATVIVTSEILDAAMEEHTSDKSNPHDVTKAQVGLGNVPNVATNDQTPTYGTVTALAKLVTGEKLGIAFGKIAKAVDALITHLSDSVKHITAEERTAWNGKAAGDHTHTAATQSAAGLMSADDKKKLDGVAASANNYSLPTATSTARGGVKIGYTANGKNYPVQLSNEQMYVNVPWTDNNTTYSDMTAATASAAGKAGLVPAPAAGAQVKYLRGDGTWQTPPDTNTTYSNMKGSSASADGTAGLVPAPTKGNQTKYLRADGTWQTPPDTNTTYSTATQSAAGLMSADDKKKLDGVAASANNYTHPTTAGNKHIPTGGAANQILAYSSSGTATWSSTCNVAAIDVVWGSKATVSSVTVEYKTNRTKALVMGWVKSSTSNYPAYMSCLFTGMSANMTAQSHNTGFSGSSGFQVDVSTAGKITIAGGYIGWYAVIWFN